jgi:hypothetical protein
MATEKPKQHDHGPSGLAENDLGPTAKAAQQQGWEKNEEQRTEQPKGKPAHYGGSEFDYGARDFGDVPEPSPEHGDETANDNKSD